MNARETHNTPYNRAFRNACYCASESGFALDNGGSPEYWRREAKTFNLDNADDYFHLFK